MPKFFISIAVMLFVGLSHCTALSADTATLELSPEMLEKTGVIAAALEGIAPEGWTAAGAVERYTIENIYDKINGRSELYMSYDIVGMTFVSLVPADSADKTTYVDIFLYDMAKAENAYGVYGVERWPGNETIALGRECYRTDTDFFLWHGQYYATLLGSGDDPKVRAAARSMAETLVKRLKDDTKDKLWGMELMPVKDRVKDSLQYFKVDAMSLDFMGNTYSANYKKADKEVTFFLSRQENEENAAEIMVKYSDMMKKYGEGMSGNDETSPPTISADMGGGYYDVVFQYKNFVGGVSAVPDSTLALSAALDLFNEAKEKLDAETGK